MVKGNKGYMWSRATRVICGQGLHVVKGIFVTWQRVGVFVSYFVEEAVVNAKTPGAISLLGQYSGCGQGTAAGFDDACLYHLLDILFSRRLLSSG